MAEEHWLQKAQERVGSVLRQKWRLDRLLGVGGMAAVYAATHRNGKRAAVKVLHPELAMNPDLRTRFLREGYVANTVDHPGTVSVLDDDSDEEGCVYLVMELLEGETLEARWERKHNRLDAGEVLSITDKLLDVLGAAHDKHVIHRDLKPENVFLTREGVVKVLDFGIARLLEMSAYSSRTTRAGSAMGTPAFMPPEQAAGDWDAVDERTDLWAVGAVMFTLISGRFVHEGRNLNEQLIASATKPAPSLAVAAPQVAPAVVSFVDKALAFRKGDRWPNARVMQLALREAYWAKDQSARRVSRIEMYPPVDRSISIHMPAAKMSSIEKAAAEASALEVAADVEGPPTDERLEASGASDALTDPDATVYEPRAPNLAFSAPPPAAASLPPPRAPLPRAPAPDDTTAEPIAAASESTDEVEEEDMPTIARVGAFDPTVPLELRGSVKQALRDRMGAMPRSSASREPVAAAVPPPSAPSSPRVGPVTPSAEDDDQDGVDEESVAVFRLERPSAAQRVSGAPLDVKQIRVLASKAGLTIGGVSASSHPMALRGRTRVRLVVMGAAVALFGALALLVARVTQWGTATAVAGAAPEAPPLPPAASSLAADAGSAAP